MLLLLILTPLLIAISFVHTSTRKLHPFAVFIWLIIIIFETLIFSTPLPLFFLLLSIVIVKLLARAEQWNMYMRFSLYMLFFIILFNILLVHTGKVLWEFGPISVTYGSVEFAYTMALRLLILMAAFAIFSSHLDTDNMFLIFEKLHVPEKTYMTFIIAIRFFEVLSEDARESMLAFRVRGIPVTDSSLKNKIKYRYPVMVTLLKNSMDRAMDIAETLEVRGFPSGHRKAWRTMQFAIFDYLAIGAIIAGGALCLMSTFIYANGMEISASLLPALLIISGGKNDD